MMSTRATLRGAQMRAVVAMSRVGVSRASSRQAAEARDVDQRQEHLQSSQGR